uniref:Protein kinase domain-containing protein n=1 Tax=Panagrolaimus davidi TaxID=227884 RepID=A0A914PLZ8_9BILA
METNCFKNCIVAIKTATTMNKYELEQVYREIDVALKIGFNHHICCLLGWTKYQQIPMLIFEHVDGPNLHSWIQASPLESKSEKDIAKILWQICDAMMHISASGVVHNDLAARNILLNSLLEVKVADFGLASLLDEIQIYIATTSQKRLPLRWMAIEAMKDRIFSEASDVWSFGVLIWEIFNNGNVPYADIDGKDILKFLAAGNRLKVSKANIWETLMLDCWKKERQERPSFVEIKKQIEEFLYNEDIKYGYINFESENEIKEHF